MKTILSSKTVWLNIISFALVLIALPEFISIIPASFIPYIALVNFALNYILRTYFTNQPLTAFAARQAPTSVPTVMIHEDEIE